MFDQTDCDAMKFILADKLRKQDADRWSNVVSYYSDTPRTRRCQYMAGDDHVICGKPVERDSYCQPHWTLTHVQHVLKPREAYR